MTVVGSVAVRIRPFVAEEDARALEALNRLVHDLAAAFDRFEETFDPTPPPKEIARVA